jgi:hypothetical protein
MDFISCSRTSPTVSFLRSCADNGHDEIHGQEAAGEGSIKSADLKYETNADH